MIITEIIVLKLIKMTPNKQSKVWEHMKDGGNGKAKCNHCGQEVALAGETTNLSKHLRRHHRIETCPVPP